MGVFVPENVQKAQEESQRQKAVEYQKKMNDVILKIVALFKEHQLFLGDIKYIVHHLQEGTEKLSNALNINWIDNVIDLYKQGKMVTNEEESKEKVEPPQEEKGQNNGTEN